MLQHNAPHCRIQQILFHAYELETAAGCERVLSDKNSSRVPESIYNDSTKSTYASRAASLHFKMQKTLFFSIDHHIRVCADLFRMNRTSGWTLLEMLWHLQNNEVDCLRNPRQSHYDNALCSCASSCRPRQSPLLPSSLCFLCSYQAHISLRWATPKFLVCTQLLQKCLLLTLSPSEPCCEHGQRWQGKNNLPHEK